MNEKTSCQKGMRAFYIRQKPLRSSQSSQEPLRSKFFYIFFIFLLFINIINSTSALSVTTHVPEKYTDVVAGERFYFEIEVKYPENPSRKDLSLEYEILNENGETISQSKVLKAIETQASFIDFIIIPESTDFGLYTINVKITDYEDLNEEVSSSFNVTNSGSKNIIIYLMLILGAVILVGFLVIISILRNKKR